MSLKKISFTREDLYQKVWEKRIIDVAEDYGITDDRLKKICDKMNIPLPYNGYWLKVKYKPDTFKTPLPELKPGESNSYKLEIEYRDDKDLLDRYKLLIEQEEKPENKIIVPNKFAKLHPFVSKTKEVLSKERKSSNGLLSVFRGQILDMEVAPNNLSRAANILNTLVLELEKRGFIVLVGASVDSQPITKVVFDDFDVEFELRELTRIERKLKERKYSFSKEDEYEKINVPTGVLKLEIKHFWSSGITRIIKDTKNQKLEDRLNEFVISIYQVLNYKANIHLYWEEQRKIEEENNRIAKEIEDVRNREKERTENLFKLADNWNKVKYVSGFLDEMEVALKERHLLTDEKKDWLRWARNKVKALDPIYMVMFNPNKKNYL